MTNIVRYSKTFLKRNSATILTCIGAVGTVTTAVLAAKATPKALASVEAARVEKGEDLTNFEIVKAAAPAYIPTIMTGVTTLACIFGANVLNKRQQAALMSAYALLDNSYKEYRNKVEELYGVEANSNIRAEIAKDHYEDEEVIMDDIQKLYFDFYSHRYFTATPEQVLKAQYDLNHDLNVLGGVTLNEFYESLGLDPVEGGDELGWSSGLCYEYYWESWVSFTHETTVLDDGMECIVLSYTEPLPDYEYY